MQEERAGLTAPTHLSAFVALVGLLAVSIFGAPGCGDKGTNPKDSIPPARVTDLEVVDATDHSVSLSWTAPGDDGPDGRASEYDIRFDTHPPDQSWETATKVDWASRPREGGEREEAVIEGLAPQTSYYFALRTADEVPNWSATVSNVVATATGRDSIPPASIVDFAVASVGPTSVELTWTAPRDNWTPGTLASYDIRFAMYSLTADSWNRAARAHDAPVPQPPGSRESIVVRALVAATPYALAVKAVDAWGNVSAISNIITVTTSGDTTAPGNVADLTATPVSSSAVRLTWTAPGNDGLAGTAAFYDVRYLDYSITEESWADATPVTFVSPPAPPGSSEVLVIGGLNDAADYFFGLKTRDTAFNWSSLSNITHATTPIDALAPGSVKDLSVEATGTADVTLVWTAPGDDGADGRAATYDLRYSTSPLTDLTWNSATQVETLPEPAAGGTRERVHVVALAQRTHYNLALRTVDERGNWSGLSNSVTATLRADPSWTWHIYSDGSGDAPTIQAAIDSAYGGDVVLVAAGIYHESIDFRGKGVVVRGEGGPGVTILDGSQLLTPIVTFESKETRDAVLEGFTLRLARNHGIYCQGASPVVRNNSIVNNLAVMTNDDLGGGMVAVGSPLIEGNHFEANESGSNGGCINLSGGSPIIRGNTFKKNRSTYDGGVIVLRSLSGECLIEGNQFLENVGGDHGGVMEISSEGPVMIRNNLFVKNVAKGNDLAEDSGTGGALSLRSARNVIVANNTFVWNEAINWAPCTGGDILFARTTACQVARNIFFGSIGCAVACYSPFNGVRFEDNLFWGSEPQVIGASCEFDSLASNLMVDPLFCAPERGDFHVANDSPAIRTGFVIGAYPEVGCTGRVATIPRLWNALRTRYVDP